jgi:hypothetical protein
MMVSEYADDFSPCCDATMRRPAGGPPDAPWFCVECGGTDTRDLASALIGESQDGTIAALYEPLT